MGQKIEVTQSRYDQVRAIEESKGIKATDSEWMIFIPECLSGIWGVYRVTRCYKSFTKYYADLSLIVAVSNELEANAKVLEFSK